MAFQDDRFFFGLDLVDRDPRVVPKELQTRQLHFAKHVTQQIAKINFLNGKSADHFLEVMRGAYRITVDEKTINDVRNCYWMTPTLLYLMHRHNASKP